jgi:hypothetical protein
MYRLKNSKAYAHGCYIRPTNKDLWRLITRLAGESGKSISLFVNDSLFHYLTGERNAKRNLQQKKENQGKARKNYQAGNTNRNLSRGRSAIH